MKLPTKYFLPFLLTIIILVLCGWGSTGHKVISTDATLLFKGKAGTLSYISNQIITHASDADNRKSADTTESPKHFIDIDSYPEFVSTGRISMDYDSLVSLHGQSFVTNTGTLPWAIVNTFDSLKAAFSRNDWNKAGLLAADLGHYVGDSHMPLHLTENYNGYQTNQSGVHSRYESDLINRYSSQIIFNVDSVQFIPNVKEYIFSYIYNNYKYKDSVLNADNAAKAFAGSTKGSAYLQKFWEIAGTFTDSLFKNASEKLASLIYTAWVDAGSPPAIISQTNTVSHNPEVFLLKQNYPNPFNPTTTIEYELPAGGFVKLEIFNALGKEVATMVNGQKAAGKYTVVFNSANLSSGVYVCRLNVHAQNTGKDYHQSKKMLLIK